MLYPHHVKRFLHEFKNLSTKILNRKKKNYLRWKRDHFCCDNYVLVNSSRSFQKLILSLKLFISSDSCKYIVSALANYLRAKLLIIERYIDEEELNKLNFFFFHPGVRPECGINLFDYFFRHQSKEFCSFLHPFEDSEGLKISFSCPKKRQKEKRYHLCMQGSVFSKTKAPFLAFLCGS